MPYDRLSAEGKERQGERMRYARDLSGFSQEAVADELGVAVTTVRKWEKGSIPAPEMRPRIAGLYGRDEAELFYSVNYQRSLRAAAFGDHLFDVPGAHQRASEFGPPWKYVSTEDGRVHLSTDHLLTLDRLVCGQSAVTVTDIGKETRLGAYLTCPRCANRAEVVAVWVAAACGEDPRIEEENL